MRKDIEEEITNKLKKKREEFMKNILKNNCKECNSLPEGKFCSRECYLPSIFHGNQYRIGIIIDIMKREFNIKDEDLFDDLCDELVMMYY